MGFLFLIWKFFEIPGLVAVCTLVALISCTEFSRMIEPKSLINRWFFVFVSFGFFLSFTYVSQSFLIFLGFFMFLVCYFVMFTNYSIDQRFNKLASWTIGTLYCGVFTGIVVLALKEFGESFFLPLLLVSFLTDTFAYLGGRLIGKRPLSPMLSPKKTVEGSLIGLVGGASAAFWYLSSLENSSPTYLIVLTCIAASLFSQVGDLFESMIKRYSGVKDSGKILPGHGGILDRIDGLLFASPFVYIWMVNFT